MPPFIERPSPATTAPAACLPAPAVAGQGVGTRPRMYSLFHKPCGMWIANPASGRFMLWLSPRHSVDRRA